MLVHFVLYRLRSPVPGPSLYTAYYIQYVQVAPTGSRFAIIRQIQILPPTPHSSPLTLTRRRYNREIEQKLCTVTKTRNPKRGFGVLKSIPRETASRSVHGSR